MLNCLDPDQDRQNVCPHLAPDCLQKLSADDKSPPAMMNMCDNNHAFVVC